MKRKNIDYTYLLLFLVPIFWGGAFVAAKFVVQQLPPFTVASIRFLLATLCLMVIVHHQGGERVRIEKRDLSVLFALGLTGVFAYNACFFTGLQFTTATNGSLIGASNPMITALLSAMFLGERLSWLKIMGITTSFLGVMVVISKGQLSNLFSLKYNMGDIILLGAPLAWAIYSIVGKGILRKFSPLLVTTYACGLGTLMLLPFALWELSVKGWGIIFSVSWQGWLAIAYMAFFASVLGFVWWYKGVEKLGASRTSIFTNLVPVSAVFLAMIFLGEKVLWADLLGAFLVLSGVYLTTKK